MTLCEFTVLVVGQYSTMYCLITSAVREAGGMCHGGVVKTEQNPSKWAIAEERSQAQRQSRDRTRVLLEGNGEVVPVLA
jgi:hypothetical protein